MSSVIVGKRFTDEFTSLLDRIVRIVTTHGTYEGRLIAYNTNDYSLWLADVKNDKGELIPKIFLNGNGIMRIEILERGPDISKLVERLNRLFPNLVTYYPESDTIVVMDRIRITRDGVIGEGPAAEKVRKVYEEFIKEEATRKP